MRYRWIDKQGAPVSPAHHSLATAARWLGREPRRSRARVLTCERGHQLARSGTSRTTLDALDKAAFLTMLPPRVPPEARPFLRRTEETVRRRRSRQAALPMMMRHLRGARHDDQI